jgi:hypothetical protein
VVHGWAKRGPRGRRKVWELREVQITATDLAAIRGGAVESWRS